MEVFLLFFIFRGVRGLGGGRARSFSFFLENVDGLKFNTFMGEEGNDQ